jgi:glycosyltransferase involved in cell wall biosynthesis
MVCYFDPDTYPGVFNASNFLVSKGWEVDVIGVSQHRFAGKPFDPRVSIFRVLNWQGRRKSGGARSFLKFIRDTRRIGRERNWDFVFGHNMYGIVAAHFAGIPDSHVSFWSQDLVEPSSLTLGQKVIFLLKKRVLAETSLVIAPSETRANALRRFFRLSAEPVVVYNSPPRQVSVEKPGWRERLKIDGDTKILAYAGGLGNDRFIEEIITSVSLMPQELALVIAGYGSPETIRGLELLAQKLGVGHRVFMVGHVPDVLSLVNEADFGISLVASDPGRRNRHHVGLASNKIFEYLAMGKPVIVSSNWETEAFMEKYRCGVCVRECTAPGIAKAVLKIMSRGAENRALVENARKVHIENTHFEKRFQLVWEEMLKAGRHSSNSESQSGAETSCQ